MAESKDIARLLLVGILLTGTCEAQGDWSRALIDNLNRMTQNIQASVNQLTQRIQQDVHTQLAQVNDNITKNLANATVINSNGNTLVLGNGAVSHVIDSGISGDGHLFHRQIEDRVIGDVLYHTERIYDTVNKTVNVARYKLNLKDPNSKPEPIVDQN